MKTETIFRAISRPQFFVALLAGFLLTTPAAALTSNITSVKFCEAGNIICAIKTTDSINMVMGGLSYLSELDNKMEPNISNISFACESLTHRLTGDAEWSAFLSELRHGKVLNMASANQGGRLLGNENCRLGEVPVSAAGWLFATALIGFVGLSNKRRV